MSKMLPCDRCKRHLFPDQFHKSNLPAKERICIFCIRDLDSKAKNPKKPKVPKRFRPKKKKARKDRVKVQHVKTSLPGTSYYDRDFVLLQMGFKTYRDYLLSELWVSIRRRVYGAKGNRCYLCGDRASQIHHARYHVNDLTGATLDYLHPICDECHAEVEFDGDKKRSLDKASEQLQACKEEYSTIRDFLGSADHPFTG